VEKGRFKRRETTHAWVRRVGIFMEMHGAKAGGALPRVKKGERPAHRGSAM
jgi:hypothetical protein